MSRCTYFIWHWLLIPFKQRRAADHQPITSQRLRGVLHSHSDAFCWGSTGRQQPPPATSLTPTQKTCQECKTPLTKVIWKEDDWGRPATQSVPQPLALWDPSQKSAPVSWVQRWDWIEWEHPGKAPAGKEGHAPSLPAVGPFQDCIPSFPSPKHHGAVTSSPLWGEAAVGLMTGHRMPSVLTASRSEWCLNSSSIGIDWLCMGSCTTAARRSSAGPRCEFGGNRHIHELNHKPVGLPACLKFITWFKAPLNQGSGVGSVPAESTPTPHHFGGWKHLVKRNEHQAELAGPRTSVISLKGLESVALHINKRNAEPRTFCLCQTTLNKQLWEIQQPHGNKKQPYICHLTESRTRSIKHDTSFSSRQCLPYHLRARFRPTEAPEGRYKLHTDTGVLPRAPNTVSSPPACRGNYCTED